MNITIQGRSARIRQGYVIIGLSKAFKANHNPPFNELKFKLPKNITNVVYCDILTIHHI